ncbi:hypothetical protein Clacol_003061 [Clathrus columnatus]|uniref:Aromatic-L-amino-acid decarboxylase n=1 Tax=Clathrus columnatus TaxID=1419009 RepID=A0AAV5A5B9_9AGAM|nr:hypothetical protein Clacol_003061 [Clathrus columnatus]
MDLEGAGHQAIDKICDYLQTLEEGKLVPDVKPGFLREALPDNTPEDGEKFDDIAEDFERLILPGILNWQHPMFFAWFPTAGTYESMLGDLYSSSVSNPGFNWSCSPACTELEAVVMDWSAKLFHLDDVFFNSSRIGGGVMQTTASDSALVAVIAARAKYQRRHPEVPLEKLLIYFTTATHALGVKTGLILGLKCRALQVTAKNNYALQGEEVSAALEEDRAAGFHPFVLIATIGTTYTGAVDRIDEIGPITRNNGLWLHIDAAWAGVALACPEYHEACYLNGINTYADSFCTNFHKWGLVNFDASTLWVRDRSLLTEALDCSPAYLRSKQSDEGTVVDYRNWQLPLGRRFRSVKVWFVLRSYGIEGFRSYLRKGITLAKQFQILVRSDPRFEIVTPPFLALTVFRIRPPSDIQTDRSDADINNTMLNALNRIFHRRLSAKDLFLTSIDLDGIFCIRLAIGSQRTEERHIKKVWDILDSEVEPAVNEWLGSNWGSNTLAD